eukprot:superscaffoldBa00001914_g12497
MAEWQKFDNEMDMVLEATAKVDVQKTLQTMTTIIASMVAERFGVKEDPTNISQFRIISLLSVEGRIFFSIVAKRLVDFLLKNHYIDTSVRKVGISGVPGCLECTRVVTQLLRDAKENRVDLMVLWLDPANTYGSMPHKLVQEMLKRHHMSDCTISVILFALAMNMLLCTGLLIGAI